MNVDEIIRRIKLQGVTVESEIIKADVIREIIYKRVEEMLVWGKVIPIINLARPDVRFEYPSKIEVEGPLAPQAESSADVITWGRVDFSIHDKYEGRFIIDDMALARQLRNEQYRAGVRRLTESMQKKEDAEMQSAVDAGAGNTIAATAAWNATGADPAKDMIAAIRKVLKAEDATIDDMARVSFVMPVECYCEIMKLQDIANIRTSLLQWMTDTYKVKFYPTKTLDTTMFCLIAGSDTARHYVFRPPNVPLVEEGRIKGVGVEYVVRRFFKTWVVPDSAAVTTSKRICKVTGVWS